MSGLLHYSFVILLGVLIVASLVVVDGKQQVRGRRNKRGNDLCSSDTLAEYKLTFHGAWSTEKFPKMYPLYRPHAQWSKLIGRTHSGEYQMWTEGNLSSPAFRRFMENSDSLLYDMEAQGYHGVYDTFNCEAIRSGEGGTSSIILADGLHSKVSFVVKIVPSPDWFVGVDRLDLCHNGRWRRRAHLNLRPMDAGIDQGYTFTSPRWPSFPQEHIYEITSSYPDHPASAFLYPEYSKLPRIAFVDVERVAQYERKGPISAARTKDSSNMVMFSPKTTASTTTTPTTTTPTPLLGTFQLEKDVTAETSNEVAKAGTKSTLSRAREQLMQSEDPAAGDRQQHQSDQDQGDQEQRGQLSRNQHLPNLQTDVAISEIPDINATPALPSPEPSTSIRVNETIVTRDSREEEADAVLNGEKGANPDIVHTDQTMASVSQTFPALKPNQTKLQISHYPNYFSGESAASVSPGKYSALSHLEHRSRGEPVSPVFSSDLQETDSYPSNGSPIVTLDSQIASGLPNPSHSPAVAKWPGTFTTAKTLMETLRPFQSWPPAELKQAEVIENRPKSRSGGELFGSYGRRDHTEKADLREVNGPAKAAAATTPSATQSREEPDEPRAAKVVDDKFFSDDVMVDCQVSEWGEWGPCSKTCGFGVRVRLRDVISHSKNGGYSCPLLQQETLCGTMRTCNWDHFSFLSRNSSRRMRKRRHHHHHGEHL